MKKLSISIFFAFFLSISMSFAQDIRVTGGFQVFGYIEGSFDGFGVGIENPVGKYASLNFDVNAGWGDTGQVIEYRPSVNFYFNSAQKGLFVGANAKYISLTEEDEIRNRWDDNLYALCLNLGLKSPIRKRFSLYLNISPHVTIGGDQEAAVAGISGQVGFGIKI